MDSGEVLTVHIGAGLSLDEASAAHHLRLAVVAVLLAGGHVVPAWTGVGVADDAEAIAGATNGTLAAVS
ncbi:MAG TPA: hypothetical protein VJ914_22470 [Pseudonocardiaceae bacterium]|nr:hypothetical protein [Pseudonocardiaceae bacterium]